MNPEARIELAAGLCEESVELARWVCLATRIDSALIRRARLTLTRGADAGVESDLWFGPLVQTAGARYILFYPEVTDLLRRQLADNRQDLARAWRVTRRTHRGLPELVRLEEKLTWLALKGGPRLERMLDALLRPLIKAMLTGQREGLGRWALNVLPHMPEAVRGSKSARLLRVVAESQLYGGWANLLTTAGEGPTDEEAALLLHGLERTSAGLRLTGDRLEVSEPPEDYSRIIKVPATNPRVLEVTWQGSGGTPVQSRLTWQKGERAHANHVSLPATVNTLAGDTHRLVRAVEVAESHRQLAAPFVVFIRGREGEPVGMGFLIGNNFTLTTLRSVRNVLGPQGVEGIERIGVSFAYREYAGRLALPFRRESLHEAARSTADGPLLLDMGTPFGEPRPTNLKSAFDFVGKVLAAPGLPPYDNARNWATFEVGAMTEAGDYPLIPATQLKPEELARWSGSPLLDVSTGDVVGVALFHDEVNWSRLSLYSLNKLPREFPEIFNEGSTALIIFSNSDAEPIQEFVSRMMWAGLAAERLMLWNETLLPPDAGRFASMLDEAAAVLMFVTPDFLSSDFVADDKLQLLLKRAEEKGTLILSLVLRASMFPATGIARYQAFNDPQEPLITLSDDGRNHIYDRLAQLISMRVGDMPEEREEREEPQAVPTYDFFISYHEADEAWAEWVTAELEGEGYTTTAQAWESKLDSTFMTTMQGMMKSSDRVIALLSPDYLASEFTQTEWRTASAASTSGESKLVPVRVREVNVEERLARVNSVVYVDLVGRPEQEARAALLGVVETSRAKANKTRPPKAFDERAAFPGVTPNVPPVVPDAPPAPAELTIDLFVSYAHAGNQPLEASPGWLELFIRNLETSLVQTLGEEVTIWHDMMLRGAQVLDHQISDALSKSRLFVAVVTPGYLNSEHCRRELREFALRAEQTGGVLVGERSRILKVVMTRMPPDMMPDELRDTLGYEFFEYDAESGRVHELAFAVTPERERRYWEKLSDLTYDIAEMLKALKRGAPKTRPLEEKKEEVNNAVYLAETTRDVRQERDAIRRELEQRGYGVLPEAALPMYAPDFYEAVRESLASCRMSVHLFGARYGIIPEGESGRSVAHRQLELAAERASSDPNFVRLVWISPGLEPADERQGALVRELQAGVRAGMGTELIQAKLETLKTHMVERLATKPEAPPAA